MQRDHAAELSRSLTTIVRDFIIVLTLFFRRLRSFRWGLWLRWFACRGNCRSLLEVVLCDSDIMYCRVSTKGECILLRSSDHTIGGDLHLSQIIAASIQSTVLMGTPIYESEENGKLVFAVLRGSRSSKSTMVYFGTLEPARPIWVPSKNRRGAPILPIG